ncbi:MAG: hypothetical protein ABIC04_00825 [Nanoarchaeota archaeon]
MAEKIGDIPLWVKDERGLRQEPLISIVRSYADFGYVSYEYLPCPGTVQKYLGKINSDQWKLAWIVKKQVEKAYDGFKRIAVDTYDKQIDFYRLLHEVTMGKRFALSTKDAFNKLSESDPYSIKPENSVTRSVAYHQEQVGSVVSIDAEQVRYLGENIGHELVHEMRLIMNPNQYRAEDNVVAELYPIMVEEHNRILGDYESNPHRKSQQIIRELDTTLLQGATLEEKWTALEDLTLQSEILAHVQMHIKHVKQGKRAGINQQSKLHTPATIQRML